MKNCYINGIGIVNAIGTWSSTIFDEAIEVREHLAYANQPSYKDLIAPAMVRRMSKGVKMGIHAAQQALDEAKITVPEAIITGTGLGCLEDSEKFLKNILDNDEQFLTPTSFIQSTHNTVGAQIALRLGCKGYNFTYVNGAVSFESALLDGLMQLQEGSLENVLVGGIDEIYGHTFQLKELIQEVKASDVHQTVKESDTAGVNFGEGGTFFALSTEKVDSTYAEIVDVWTQNNLETEDFSVILNRFLSNNGIEIDDVSALVLGINGDVRFDSYYSSFIKLFNECPVLYYKNVVGHSDVASAFGLAVAAYALKNQKIPSILKWNDHKHSALKYVILYNQYLGKDHSLTLIKHV